METLTRFSPPVAGRRPRISLWLLRVVLSVHAIAVLSQPVLAGQFLSGDVDSIALHGVIGSWLAVLAILAIGVTVVYVVAGRGRLWILPVAVLLFFAVGIQVGAGYERTLDVHVPLGVGLAVLAVLLVIWVWSPSAAQARVTR
jgi:hypothetical protein